VTTQTPSKTTAAAAEVEEEVPPLCIAHVLSSFGMGGQERVALDLAVEQVRRGHRVHAVSIAPLPHGVLAEAFRSQGIAVHSVPKGRGVDPRVVLGLVKLIRRERIDVLHTHNPQPLVYGSVAGKLTRRVVVHTKHGANPDAGRRLWLRRASGHLVKAYVAVSDATADVARRNRECVPSRLSIIRNGIDLGAYHPDDLEARRAIREELGIPQDAFVFGTIGRVSVEKDHVLLVKAAGPLLGPKVRLVIVGDGSEMERVRAASSPFVQSIVLTGLRRDVPRLLTAFDAFVLSSKSEGLPIALLEAMATGLAIVSTSVGGVPEVVEHGAAAILVPAGDEGALRKALVEVQAPCRREALAARARIRAQAFDVKAAVDAYLALYRR
jgi:glycosyltransferase involved in cell wall biosynthesis